MELRGRLNMPKALLLPSKIIFRDSLTICIKRTILKLMPTRPSIFCLPKIQISMTYQLTISARLLPLETILQMITTQPLMSHTLIEEARYLRTKRMYICRINNRCQCSLMAWVSHIVTTGGSSNKFRIRRIKTEALLLLIAELIQIKWGLLSSHS